MTLSNAHVESFHRIPTLLQHIREEPAPTEFSSQALTKIGFTSSSCRAFVGLLKSLGFLGADSKPTERYLQYQDHSKSRHVLGVAIRESYRSLFLFEPKPLEVARESIEAIFRNYHDCSDAIAKIMADTFLALVNESDIIAKRSRTVSTKFGRRTGDSQGDSQVKILNLTQPAAKEGRVVPLKIARKPTPYNIQINLPTTTDREVYLAMFRSLREVLLQE